MLFSYTKTIIVIQGLEYDGYIFTQKFGSCLRLLFTCWLEIRAGHGINAKQDGRRQLLDDPWHVNLTEFCWKHYNIDL